MVYYVSEEKEGGGRMKNREFLKELKNLMEKYNVEIEMNIEEDDETFNAWFEIGFLENGNYERIKIDGTSFNKDDFKNI